MASSSCRHAPCSAPSSSCSSAASAPSLPAAGAGGGGGRGGVRVGPASGVCAREGDPVQRRRPLQRAQQGGQGGQGGRCRALQGAAGRWAPTHDGVRRLVRRHHLRHHRRHQHLAHRRLGAGAVAQLHVRVQAVAGGGPVARRQRLAQHAAQVALQHRARARDAPLHVAHERQVLRGGAGQGGAGRRAGPGGGSGWIGAGAGRSAWAGSPRTAGGLPAAAAGTLRCGRRAAARH